MALEALETYILSMGVDGEVLSGWSATADVRKSGESMGHVDVYFHSKEGHRFRSRKECLKFLNIDHTAQQMPKVPKVPRRL